MSDGGGKLPLVRLGDAREAAERLENQRIAQAARFVERTGRCCICRVALRQAGMTCGADFCRQAWLFPGGLPNGGDNGGD